MVTGGANPLKTGGKTMTEDKAFYKSKAWKTKREAILRRDKYQCQYMKRYGKAMEAQHVHHIFPLEYYPEFRLCSWNLISLSTDAHNRMHDRETHELTAEGQRLLEKTARVQGLDRQGRKLERP